MLRALGTNTVVRSVVLTGAGINDALAGALGEVLRTNESLRALQLECNAISPGGIEALAAGLACNSTLSTLKLAHQRVPFLPQATEMALADAVSSSALTKFSIELRHVPARDAVEKALRRNQDRLRELGRRSSEYSPS